ncbi:MAG: DUF1080 domain-containing protein [Bryobacteraceae bacterium]
MRTIAVMLLASLPGLAAVSDFNGRWNLKVHNEARKRVWWLEVSGAGTGAVKGRFVGFPGGDMAGIPSPDVSPLRVDGQELTFTCTRAKRRIDYRVRMAKGQLEGTSTEAGQVLHFTGRRAPVIRDKDDGTGKHGKPVALFNGKDLAGWAPVVEGQPLGWSVKGGILSNVAAANNLISESKFWNFDLHAEYRIGPDSNSGIGLRARYEVQILADYGQPPNSHGHGALYSRIKPKVNATRPAGAWQVMDIRLVGRQLTVRLNGQMLIDKGEVEGLTAMATDTDEDQPGPIVLQGDHRVVEFRKLVVTPLAK